jgi:glycosyltransferase involved in cell wall biosynthesis
MTLVAFVVPTVGRPSLAASLESIARQTDPGWSAHVEPSRGSAAATRNAAISRLAVGGAEWIGFLDDDDTIHPSYVAWLRQHAAEWPAADVIVFRMSCWAGRSRACRRHHHALAARRVLRARAQPGGSRASSRRAGGHMSCTSVRGCCILRRNTFPAVVRPKPCRAVRGRCDHVRS